MRRNERLNVFPQKSDGVSEFYVWHRPRGDQVIDYAHADANLFCQ